MTVGLSCRGLVYIYRLEGYDVVALGGVDLDISPGEAVALVGPSGSGKSTLLSVFAGLLPPAAGRLMIGDQDVTKASPAELAELRSREVGVVLQGTNRNLLPYLTAEQNVKFAQGGATGRARRDLPAARDVLSLVGLSGRTRMKTRPHQLTPGERQRLALAVALANRPGLLLADEPTSQLDTRARDEVLAALGAIRRDGTTVVVVTHDPTVGAQMGRTITIRDGRVGAEGRLGNDYSVVARDGSIHLPPEVLEVFAPGSLVEVHLEPDGTARLVPAGSISASPGRSTSAGDPTRARSAASPAPEPRRAASPAPQPVRDLSARDLSARDLAAREQAVRELAAREVAAREQSARDQAERALAERAMAARDQAARDLAAREQAVRDQAAREQAAREQAAREQEQPTGRDSAGITGFTTAGSADFDYWGEG